MKLLSLTVNRNDSTSFYRANGVFHDLKNRIPIEITSMDFNDIKNMSWSHLMLYDVVFMQRPFQNVALQILQYCKELNIPVWVDYDDNLFQLPTDNPAYSTFMNPQTQSILQAVIKNATILTVSTAALMDAFSAINQNIRVIPNAFNSKLFNYRLLRNGKNKILLWRGSNTHANDIFSYANEIIEAQLDFNDWNFLYYGFNPWFLPETQNFKTKLSTDPVLYFRDIHNIAPAAMHVPLVKNIFNMCKSNIALIEGTFAGAACLVPDWSEWKIPGAINYSNPAEYSHLLTSILKGEIDIEFHVKTVWEYILDNLTLEKVNALRVTLLNEL